MPVPSASRPSTCCRYNAVTNWKPSIPATISTITTFAPATARIRNSRSGSSGVRAFACRTTNAASRTAAAASAPQAYDEIRVHAEHHRGR